MKYVLQDNAQLISRPRPSLSPRRRPELLYDLLRLHLRWPQDVLPLQRVADSQLNLNFAGRALLVYRATVRYPGWPDDGGGLKYRCSVPSDDDVYDDVYPLNLISRPPRQISSRARDFGEESRPIWASKPKLDGVLGSCPKSLAPSPFFPSKFPEKFETEHQLETALWSAWWTTWRTLWRLAWTLFCARPQCHQRNRNQPQRFCTDTVI